MIEYWKKELRFDPLPELISSRNEALLYFVRRDLLEEKVEPIETLWQLPQVIRIVSKQQKNGSWKYPGKEHGCLRTSTSYDQLETYRILGLLVEKYGLNRKHLAIQNTANFLFSCQTKEGDFRGIYNNQYTPNYTAGIMELLVKTGYEDDVQIKRGFTWLLSFRQNDGGWIIPLRTGTGEDSKNYQKAFRNPKVIEPDRTKLFSHLVTGVVLRAFAAHPEYRKTKETQLAGELLKARFFKPDKYPDRKNPGFWLKIRFPFWFTDILSALDSLSLLGFSKDDQEIEKALNWLIGKQNRNGLWKSSFAAKDREIDFWVSLAVCRVLKRFYE